MNGWAVVYERSDTGWSAYPLSLPGVGVVGPTRQKAEQLVAEAIALHLEGMAADGLPIPVADLVDVGRVQPASR